MRRHVVLAGTFTLLLANATGVAAAHDDDHEDGPNPRILATGLDNPRQLGWHQHKLLIAEGGRGGDDCDDEGICTGPTGQISAVDSPFRDRTGLSRTVVGGLFSETTPEATIGSDGVAATGFPQVFLIAEGEPIGDKLAEPDFATEHPGAETQEHLLISVAGTVIPWVDFGFYETEMNPDNKPELDSNPNAVIVVDPTPEGELGDDEFALVADAGANTVWKVDPDFDDPDPDTGLPRPDVSVFASYDASDPDAPEFVPSALDVDGYGNVYVGGVGSFVPGVAQVVRYTIDGEETGRWAGFTALNGLAVDEHGKHLYVSQILEGNVIRVDLEDETWTSFDVPFPSGLALGEDAEEPDEDQYRGSSAWGYRDDMDDSDEHGDDSGHSGDRDDAVFVSAYSVFPADADDPATDELEGGQVWRFTFPRHAEEMPLPVTAPPDGVPLP